MSSMIDELSISYEELKSLVIEAFRRRPDTQLVYVFSEVGSIAVKKEMVPPPHSGVVDGASYALCPADEDRVIEIIWDLIIERVITMGRVGVGGGWPFFKVSSYGRRVLDSPTPIPHDPSGYLARLNEVAPGVDSIILTYIQESLRTYSIGALLSSTVTLGCASEKALLLLVGAAHDAIGDASRKAKFKKKVSGRPIKAKFDALVNLLTSIKGSIPKEIADGLETVLYGVFEMIRKNRNDAGHPTGKIVAREEAYAALQVFIPYCEKLYSLIQFLKKTPI